MTIRCVIIIHILNDNQPRQRLIVRMDQECQVRFERSSAESAINLQSLSVTCCLLCTFDAVCALYVLKSTRDGGFASYLRSHSFV